MTTFEGVFGGFLLPVVAQCGVWLPSAGTQKKFFL